MKVLFAIPSDTKKIQKGSLLSETRTPSSIPIVVQDYETGTIDERKYLLVDKTQETFLCANPLRKGGYSYFYEDAKGNTIERDAQGRIINNDFDWIRKGVTTNMGDILAVGDAFAVVQPTPSTTKTVHKSKLIPIEDVRRDRRHKEEAEETLNELIKSHRRLQRPGIVSSFFKAFKSSQIFMGFPGEKEGHEGDTRSFGLNDMRTLMRGPSGKLRWMTREEVQQELARRKGKAPLIKPSGENGPKKTPDKAPGHDFRTGQGINWKGEKVEVVNHGNGIVAFKRPDGTTGTFMAEDYKPEDHSQVKPAVKETPEGETPEETAAKAAQAEKDQEELRYRPSGKATADAFYREAQRIEDEARQTPEYQEFLKTVGDYQQKSAFSFDKEMYVGELGKGELHKLNKMWDPQQRRWHFKVNGQSLNFQLNGRAHELIDIEGKNLQLRDVESGEIKKAEQQDLDKYRGTIHLDEDGNMFVVQGDQKVLGQLKGVSQQDIMQPGVIRIVKDAIYKRVTAGDGVRFDDKLLGRIESGVVAFKHGDKVMAIDANARTYFTDKDGTRKPLGKKRLAEMQDVQKKVQEYQARINTDHLTNQDLNIALARHRTGHDVGINRIGKGKPISIGTFSDVLEQYVQHGGEGFNDQILDSYGKPEWASTVKALAEMMQVEDIKRFQEIEETNRLSNSGIVAAKPHPHAPAEYEQAADDMLRNHRRSILHKQSKEKKRAEREGELPRKFDLGDLPEPPANAKAISPKVQKIRDSNDTEYHVQYAVLPATDVIPSHELAGEGALENPDHPSELQARKRGEHGSVVQMRNIAADPNDSLVAEQSDATRGAPVVFTKNGKSYVVQGNGRVAGVKGMSGDAKKKYHGMILQRAGELGMDTSNIKEGDILVRMMTDKHTYEDALQLGAFGQESSGRGLSTLERARQFQNVQRDPIEFSKVNTEGLGNKPINETNVNTFIRNNPEIWKQILAVSKTKPEQVMGIPEKQSELVNAAVMAQLDRSFIEEVAGKDDRIHNLIKRIAPSMMDNGRDIQAGKIPKSADLQKMLGKVIRSYDNLDATTKSLLTIKGGQSEFLNPDPLHANPKTLLHQMSQEDLMSTEGKDENKFRDPLHVIGLMAYHQAVMPRYGENAETDSNKASTALSLKMRRFAEALKTINEDQGDIFGATKTDDEKQRERTERIVAMAERTLIDNKPYQEGSETLTPEEADAAKETQSLGIRKFMEKQLKGFQAGIKKSFWKSQLSMFVGPNQPKGGKPSEGETRSFGPHDLRRFSATAGRWMDADEYEKQTANMKGKENQHPKKWHYISGDKYSMQFDSLGRRHWRPKSPTDQEQLFFDKHHEQKEELAEHAAADKLLRPESKQEEVDRLTSEAAREIPKHFKQEMINKLVEAGELRGDLEKMKNGDLVKVYQEKGLDEPAPDDEAPGSEGQGERTKQAIDKLKTDANKRAEVREGAVKSLPTQKEIIDILKKHPLIKLKEKVNRAFIIGSQTGKTGKDTHKLSDVDILLEVPEKAGITAEELTDQYRKLLQDHFVKNNIRGMKDELHPQWDGKRVDVYFTYDADKETRPKQLLPSDNDADKRAETRKAANQTKYQAVADAIGKNKRIEVRTAYKIIPLSKPEHIRLTKDGGVQIIEGRGKWVNLTQDQVDSLARQAGIEMDAFGEIKVSDKQEQKKQKRKFSLDERDDKQAMRKPGLPGKSLILDLFKTMIAGIKPKSPAAGKPTHIRRYRGRDGEWEYEWPDGNGGTFIGDESGKPLPKHRHWQPGEHVHVDGSHKKILDMSDSLVVAENEHGIPKTHKVEDAEHFYDHQRQLREKLKKSHQDNMFGEIPGSTIQGDMFGAEKITRPNHKYVRRFRAPNGHWYYIYEHAVTKKPFVADKDAKPAVGAPAIPHKWQSVVDELEADLEQGKLSGRYELADNAPELKRKIQGAREQLALATRKE